MTRGTRIAQFSEHQADGSELEKGQCIAAEVLEVFGEATAAIEPGQGAFDDPAHRLDHEAARLIRSFHDLHAEMWQNLSYRRGELWTLIAGIGEQLHQEGIRAEQGGQEQDAAVAVLDVGGVHHGMQQQT
jgi:hypothetical protein